MNGKRAVICNIFGHEWEMLNPEHYRTKSSTTYTIKRCMRCGKKEQPSMRLRPTGKLYFN